LTATASVCSGNAATASYATLTGIASTCTGTIAPTTGGTGLTTYATGDVIYANTTNSLAKLPVGAAGQALLSRGGIPSWEALASGGTVTSVKAGAGLIGGTITTSGIISIDATVVCTGAATATDNAIARYDGTSGKILQNSGVTIDDSNNVVLPAAGDIYTTAWVGWTPTLAVSGGTPPTYTAQFVNRYKVVGKQCWVFCLWANSSGGTAGSGANAITFTLPVSASSNIAVADPNLIGGVIGNGHCYEDVTQVPICVIVKGTTATQGMFVKTANASITGNDQSGGARTLSFSACYEID
jgi:hypothetical protein